MAHSLHDWGQFRPQSRKPMKIIGPTQVWVCCQEICEVVVHWTGGRTLPCDKFFGSKQCDLCAVELPALKEFWLLVADFRPRSKPVLVKLTIGAVEKSPNLLRHNGDLYGRLLLLSRATNSTRSAMTASLIETEDFVTLPEPGDVLANLRKLWGAPDKRKGPGAP